MTARLQEHRPCFDPEGGCSCGGQAVKRINKRTGEAFWGCSEFPKCRNRSNSGAASDHDGYGDVGYRYDYEGLGLP